MNCRDLGLCFYLVFFGLLLDFVEGAIISTEIVVTLPRLLVKYG